MAETAKEELERLRKEREGAQTQSNARSELEARRQLSGAAQGPSTLGGFVEKNIAEPFNLGLAQTVQAPTDLINAGLAGVTGVGNVLLGEDVPPPQIPGNVENLTRAAGLTPEGAVPDNLLARASNLGGATVAPQALTLKAAIRAADVLPAYRTTFQNMFAPMARRPGLAVAADAAAVGTAAAGGQAAGVFTDDPNIRLAAEMASGFAPALIASGPTINAARRAFKLIPSVVAPFTRAGAFPRAARRLQSLVADPKAASDKIRTTPSRPGELPQLSPARQTGEPKLIGLEKKVLSLDPSLEKQFTAELNAAKDELRVMALEFGGDTSRPAVLLRDGRDYLIRLVELRAAEAGQRAQAQIAAMRGNVSGRKTSQVVRKEMQAAYDDVRAAESAIWESLDTSVEAHLDNAQTALRAEIARRGKFADPADIPAWLTDALAPPSVPDSVMKSLASRGMLDSNGQIPPAILKQLKANGLLDADPISFKDVQELRSRVRTEARKLKGIPGHSRNAVRILNDVDAALLDDLAATNVEGAEAARTFSRAVNDRFTRGPAGKLLELDRTGTPKVAEEITLQSAFSSKDPGGAVGAVLAAAPDTQPEVTRFMMRYYTEAAWSNNRFSKTASDAFISKMERGGVFDVLPEARAELQRAHALGLRGDDTLLTATKTNVIARNGGKSRAALFLDADTGDEMAAILDSKNPRLAARSVHKRMRGDETAEQGLKQLFMEEIFKRSRGQLDDVTGEFLVEGRKAFLNLKDYKLVMDELGFSVEEKVRAVEIVRRLRKADIQAQGQFGGVIEDRPGVLLDGLARYIGAQQGGRLGNTMGSGLLMARFGSDRMRGALTRLTKDKASELVIQAMSDPKLFKALLVKPTDPLKAQGEAAQVIEVWLTGLAISSDLEEQ